MTDKDENHRLELGTWRSGVPWPEVSASCHDRKAGPYAIETHTQALLSDPNVRIPPYGPGTARSVPIDESIHRSALNIVASSPKRSDMLTFIIAMLT